MKPNRLWYMSDSGSMRRALRGSVALSLSVLLCACHPSGGPVDRGTQLYATLCQSCHQRDGHGASGLYASLAGTPVPLGEPNELIAWVLYGERPASLPRGQYAGVMPQFNFLSDEDAAAVINHVRSSFGNAASAVDAAAVARVRANHAGR
jgi:mono/diheme cytochrome c family protein